MGSLVTAHPAREVMTTTLTLTLTLTLCRGTGPGAKRIALQPEVLRPVMQ